MPRATLYLLPLVLFACKSTPDPSDPVQDGEEITISGDEIEPMAQFVLETRRVLVADFIRVEMTPQFFEEKMGFTRDLRYVERKGWVLKDGTRVIELRNVNTEQVTNIDPDLLPRIYFGTGFEARAYRAIRVYFRWPKTRERPLSLEVVAKSEHGNVKMWVSGRLQHERPTIRLMSELIWSEFKEEYVHKSAVD